MVKNDFSIFYLAQNQSSKFGIPLLLLCTKKLFQCILNETPKTGSFSDGIFLNSFTPKENNADSH